MGLYKRKDSDVWWMSFSTGNRQYKKSTGTEDKKLEEKILAKVTVQVQEGKWFEVEEAKKHTFDDLMQRYLETHSKVNKGAKSYNEDVRYIKNLGRVLSGLTLDRITPALISEYKTMRLEEGKAPQTVLHEMNCLTHAFNLAVRGYNWINYNPCLKVKKPKVNNQILSG